MSDTEIVSTRDYTLRSLDDMIVDCSLNSTLGELVSMRSRSRDTRSYFVSNLIVLAVFDMDIGLISEIVKRIDGMAPEKGDIQDYSNIFADALEDVLSYTSADQATIYPDDSGVIALAKATVAIATAEVGKSMQARKDRQKAVSMVLDRVEGRRSEPARPAELVEYEAPDWMGLPESGGTDDEKEGELRDSGRRSGESDRT